jgi:hypothetical protein
MGALSRRSGARTGGLDGRVLAKPASVDAPDLLGKGSDDLDQLLFGRKLSEASQTLARRFDVGPPHDPVPIDQELPLSWVM